MDVSRGSKATVRQVLAEGPPVAGSDVPEGVPIALKLPWKGNPDAPDAVDREGVWLDLFTRHAPRPPCPRLFDALVTRVAATGRERINGLFMEWCPDNLESWWLARNREPDAFPDLCLALADVCELIRDYQTLLVQHTPEGETRPNARIKPRNIARSAEGRWLLSDFEELRAKGGLYDEHLSATQPLLGGENYLPPEVLFDAKRASVTAMDTWAVGCILYALLRVRPYVSAGAALPSDGTNSPHFRTHRVHLITDLRTRKPTLLVGKELDPSRFLYPDRLPDQDRRAVLQALEGAFGERDEDREVALAADVVRVLDRALRIEPVRRYVDPVEMSRDLRALANRYHRIAKDGVRSEDDLLDEKTMLMSDDALREELESAGLGSSGPAPSAPDEPPAQAPTPVSAPPAVAAPAPVAAPTRPTPPRPVIQFSPPPTAPGAAPSPPRPPAASAMPPIPSLVATPPVVPSARPAVSEDMRTLPNKAEPAPPSPARNEPARPEPARPEPARPEPSRAESSRPTLTPATGAPTPNLSALQLRVGALEMQLRDLATPPPPPALPGWLVAAVAALLVSQVLTWVALAAMMLKG